MEKEIIISAHDLVKTFGKGANKVTAVDGVSLDVCKGEMVAVTGQSGSGKSTLMNLLGGLDKPDSGSITALGEELTAVKDTRLAEYRRRKSGFVFQFYNLIPVLNVEENIALPIHLDGKRLPKKELDDVLELLGLSERRYHFANQLSGGQQQRVSIARAIINKPPCIFADEPTGNLDSKNSREIISLFKRVIAETGTAVVLVTHDGSIAAEADRVITMQDGKIISERVRSF
ncbi:putative ABC transport system ATP-binding protein [Ruminococcus sp. YE71]|uniref:ABC transporter ATP-binding protein n=1 Tax=unclassified Ruminococcus TaxID=2608920 RepID=UPI000880ABA2|nr:MULTISPECIES: ABC transporter ATP-binding protein [unclassified Ruminococcus]SDA17153.1 putative ABC transport system ATP-binding protein [Ruminococcus sp. YE78]SFW26317.1 putative ABC transport system ATP-binding protein [Ruminococcus sp. YE71]